MRPQTRLELNKPEFQVRAQNFFALLNVPEFEQQFLSDPSGVAAKELGLKSVPRSTISTANVLIYRLLSDPNFNAWAKEFQQRIEAEFPNTHNLHSVEEVADFAKAKENKAKFMEEFSHSVVAHLAPASYEEILQQEASHSTIVPAEGDVAVALLTFIVVIVIVVVAAGRVEPDALSRFSLLTTINQLTPAQLQIIQESQNAR